MRKTYIAQHDSIFFSTNLSMPGNHTFSHRSDFVFTTPWCPSCAKFTTRSCKVASALVASSISWTVSAFGVEVTVM
jgi:hypothetical protein